jgi:hypothetical protein
MIKSCNPRVEAFALSSLENRAEGYPKPRLTSPERLYALCLSRTSRRHFLKVEVSQSI